MVDSARGGRTLSHAGVRVCAAVMGLRERNKSQRRRRILKAAARLIRQRGFEALSMRELARKARLTVPTLYNLIGDKDEILYEIMSYRLDQLNEALDTVASTDPIERIYTLFNLAIDIITEEPEVNRPVVKAILNRVDPLRAPPVIRRFMKMFVDVFAEGMRLGYFHDGGKEELMGRQVYLNYIQALRMWGWGILDDLQFRMQTQCGATLVMLALADERAQPRLRQRLEDYAGRLTDFLATFPARPSLGDASAA